jgi:ribonuclease HI
MYIYTDGASRGNGGESAAAFIIVDKDCKEIIRKVRHIGLATNNMAEYTAVLDAVQHCYTNVLFASKEEGGCKIISDSALVINQLKGIWKINNPNLKEINRQIKFYIDHIDTVFTYEWVSRSHPIITKCDKMNNGVLNTIKNLVECGHPEIIPLLNGMDLAH